MKELPHRLMWSCLWSSGNLDRSTDEQLWMLHRPYTEKCFMVCKASLFILNFHQNYKSQPFKNSTFS